MTSEFTAPQIILPKGGGKIRGIDQKFAANPGYRNRGTNRPDCYEPGPLRILTPPLTLVRLGFWQRALRLRLGSGFSPPSPARTDKGLPQYRDHDNPNDRDSDIFILSGAEDLVPVLVQDSHGNWINEPIPAVTGTRSSRTDLARRVYLPGSSAGLGWRMRPPIGAQSPTITY